MCIFTQLIQNKRYVKNKKNGGIIPAILDIRTKVAPKSCERCMECRKKKAREWQIRLYEDIKKNKNGIFVTLTFSNESIRKINRKIPKNLKGYERDNAIATYGLEHFRENWRAKFKEPIRHWMVTELGHNGTENIHMHGIMWTNREAKTIKEKWTYGYVWLGQEMGGKIQNYVSSRTVNYIVKYINKSDEIYTEYKAKVLTSSGIGAAYLERLESDRKMYREGRTEEYYRSDTGHKMAMPEYYRRKLYSEEERERLWIEKLNKQERYVDGMKIDISEGDEEYYRAVKEARKKNLRLGYQTSDIEWSKKEQQEIRRKNMLDKRLAFGEGKEEKKEVFRAIEWGMGNWGNSEPN